MKHLHKNESEISSSGGQAMQNGILKIAEMKAADSIEEVVQALEREPGVVELAVSPAKGVITIRFDENKTSIYELQATLMDTGYTTMAPNTARKFEGICCGSCGI